MPLAGSRILITQIKLQNVAENHTRAPAKMGSVTEGGQDTAGQVRLQSQHSRSLRQALGPRRQHL